VKPIILTTLIVSTLCARINPFIPVGNTDVITNNRTAKLKYFTSEELTLPSTARILKKIDLVHQNLDGTLGKVSKKVNQRIDWHQPLKVIQRSDLAVRKNRKGKYAFTESPISELDFFALGITKQALMIKNRDKIIRQFMLTQPYRIVIDFDRDANFTSVRKQFKNSYFTRIAIGNHDKYYRVVLYLDNYYDYTLKSTKRGGYLIELR